LWPLIANIVRLLIAAGGGWLALRWAGSLGEVLAAQGVALAAFGLINAAAVAGGVWFTDAHCAPRAAAHSTGLWSSGCGTRKRQTKSGRMSI
jgi:hypothetical protein